MQKLRGHTGLLASRRRWNESESDLGAARPNWPRHSFEISPVMNMSVRTSKTCKSEVTQLDELGLALISGEERRGSCRLNL